MNIYARLTLTGLLGAALYAGGCSLFLSIIGSSVGFLAARFWRYTWVIVTIPRDVRALCRYVVARIRYERWVGKKYTIQDIFKENVRKNPTKTAIIFEDQAWTFRDLDEYTNSVANYFYGEGYRRGDVVALLIENRLESVGLWFGLAKIGVITSMINFNLRGDQLLHCITISGVKAIIFGTEKSDVVREVLPQFPEGVKLYSSGPTPTDVPAIYLNGLIDSSSRSDQPKRDLDITDDIFYIFTSGTTGLPKAAIFKQTRLLMAINFSRELFNLSSDDIIYNPLPLYHTAGTVCGVGNMIVTGLTVVIIKKFSASRHLIDCIKYNCTVSMYIGEICRYLLAQPVRPTDKQHKLRLMYGNGLRKKLWQPFIDRFGVRNIVEFYGSTEGNVSMVNMFSKLGAIGFNSRILPWINPIALIKMDKPTGEPLRDRQGLCINSEIDEPGMAVGFIRTKDPLHEFSGYLDKSASNRKIIENVFKKGDAWFMSGDILTMDELGYYYFHDRAGDTFRWKGENVSTTEVEGIVSRILGHVDSTAYGVQVDGCEGRAGMAAIVCQPEDMDFNNFENQLQGSLPSYARPVFLRFCKSLEITGTFKYMKVCLRDEGYNPTIINDPLFYINLTSMRYEPLTVDVYTQISTGYVRF